MYNYFFTAEVADMFRNPKRSVTAFWERYVAALKKDEGSEEVLTMREAMNDFHKSINNTTPLPANIIVMPPYEYSHSQSSANITNNSKVSQITTRRTEKNKYN